jgi:reactive intermediate/imine deaminase
LPRIAKPGSIFARATSAAATMPVNSDIVRGQPGPRFNQYVVHGGVCYLSGQVARGTSDGSVAAQTRTILSKIDNLLIEAGTDKSRLLSVSIWLSDITAGLNELNAEWDAWVDKNNMPVRATVESKLVDSEITVEIQATAAMPPVSPVVISTDRAAAAVGPYNQAVRVADGTVYVSGCIGLVTGPGAGFKGPTVEEQTEQALNNLAAIVGAAGEGARIVKAVILLADMADFATVNKLYEAFFAPGGPCEGPAPARSCFAAKSLPKGALVEIEAVAIIPK